MITNIQVLRAFAAFIVIHAHIYELAARYGYPAEFLSLGGTWGFSGVDMFFVISGFVMAYAQAISPKPWCVFAMNRIIRIVPIYWVLSALLLSIYLLLPAVFSVLETDLSHVFGSFLFITPWVSQQEMPLLYVGWTLEWEMLFYVLFTLALFLKNPRHSMILLGGLLMALALIFKAYLIIEFAFGLLVALIYLKYRLSAQVGMMCLAFGVIMLGAVAFWATPLEEVHRVIKWGVPSFFIVLGLVHIFQTKSKVLSFLGDASYSVYLVQVFTISTFYKSVPSLFDFLPHDVLLFSCLIGSVITGCITHVVIEKPMTRYLKSLQKKYISV